MLPDVASASAWIFAILAAFVVSAIVTWLGIGYAHRRRLIDQPGARRSHTEPTPRGGGIGIVIAVLAFGCIPLLFAPSFSGFTAITLIIAVTTVAAVGWIDDHRGLAARWRFIAHCFAAIIVLLPIIAPLTLEPLVIEDATSLSASTAWLLVALAIITIVWSINLHNFMDGINGILSMQAIFVFSALAALCWRDGGTTTHVGQIAVFAAAAAGFLPFNFPRARIFMGDVGSGVIGLLIAFSTLWQIATARSVLASGLILSSAFVIDASCTLISRMLRGRRWYSAHREHLYQWLARSGLSHAGVVALYMGWNLVIVVPVIGWINIGTDPRMPISGVMTDGGTPGSGLGPAAGIYLLGIAAWFAGKCYCLRRARSRHAAA